MAKQHYSASEAAAALGISLDTLRRWDRTGRIRVTRDRSNRRVVSAAEIDRLRGDGQGTHISARNRFRATVTDVQVEGLMAQVELVVADPVRLRRDRHSRRGRGTGVERRDGRDRDRQVDQRDDPEWGEGGLPVPSRRSPRLALLAAVSALSLLALLAGPASPARRCAPSAQITVYAAASLTNVFPAIEPKERYSFGGSNTLAAQIKQGAPADVFASANMTLPKQLFQNGLCSKPIVFTRNKLVIVVPKANRAHIRNIYNLTKSGVKIDVAGSGIPVGTYTQQILKNMNLPPRS